MDKKIIMIILSFFILVELGIYIIISNKEPVKLKNNTFNFEYGNEISTDVNHYMNVNDGNKDYVKLDFSSLKNEVGSYNVKAIYNNKEYPFNITIMDTTNPTGKLKKNSYNVLIGEPIKASYLLTDVEDKSPVNIYFEENENHKETENITYKKAGSYVERIIIKDIYGNTSSTFRVMINVTKTYNKPTIQGVKNTTIKKGNTINLKDGIKAYDSEDGDITNKIVISGKVGNKIGDYTITYSVTNSNKMTCKVKRIITVE